MNYTTKTIIWWFLTLSVPKKFKKFIFEIPRIAQVLNINNLRTTSAMSINLQTIRKLIEYSLEIVLVKTMFTLTVFEILLSQGRSVLWPPSKSLGAKGLKFQWKTRKIFGICWNCLNSDWFTSFGGFEWFSILWFSLTLSVPEDLKNLIYEMPIIAQTLNINNLRTTSA